MYDLLPSFILGFHGCDKAVAEKIFAGRSYLKPSKNDFDWLGHGVYFWENNPQRAMDYAILLKQNPHRSRYKINNPAVIGAVIDPGVCLNLLDAQYVPLLKSSYEKVHATCQKAGNQLPVNKPIGKSQDILLRPLDCAVIEMAHSMRETEGVSPFDSTRGVFIEGRPAYPGAGIHELNHIQVCIRNPRCIKGYFRVLREPDSDHHQIFHS